MLRNSLSLLFMVAFASAVSAQPHRDVQSLQYEFGRPVARAPVPPAIVPYSCKPVVYAPVARTYCCVPVYTACHPCYTPRCYPAPTVHRVIHRRVFMRSVHHLPYYCW